LFFCTNRHFLDARTTGIKYDERVTQKDARMTFPRISVNPAQMNGVPCIRGLRIPVATVVGLVADGLSDTDILCLFPDLERDDIREALRYAAEAVRERELPLISLA
jgi:uncharacterized protein (DUF433 family)